MPRNLYELHRVMAWIRVNRVEGVSALVGADVGSLLLTNTIQAAAI
jgi:hypothetical protein